MKKMTQFEEYCNTVLSGLYDPNFTDVGQCWGYHKLKNMVIEEITPASLEEIKRWETNPTPEDLASTPGFEYLRFLHPILRPDVINNWDYIKNLKLTLDEEDDECEFTDEELNVLLYELHNYGTANSNFEQQYGLPIYDKNNRQDMREIVKKFLKRE